MTRARIAMPASLGPRVVTARLDGLQPFPIQLLRLPERQPARREFDPGDIVIQLVESGNGTASVGNKCYPVRRNSVLIAKSESLPVFSRPSNAEPERRVLAFSHALCQSLFPASVCDNFPPVLVLPRADADAVRQCLDAIGRELPSRFDYHWEMMVLNVQKALIILYRSYSRKIRAHAQSPLIANMKSFIEDKLTHPIDRRDVARHFHCSVRQLTRIFQKDIGTTVQQYIIRRRIERAKFLIHSSDITIKLIADQVGMSSLRAFNRAFRMMVGMTPKG